MEYDDIMAMDIEEFHKHICMLWKQKLTGTPAQYEDFDDVMLELINDWASEWCVSCETAWELIDNYHYEGSLDVYGTYESYEEVAHDRVTNDASLPDYMEHYFDFEAYGRDIVSDDEYYFEANDGTIVNISY